MFGHDAQQIFGVGVECFGGRVQKSCRGVIVVVWGKDIPMCGLCLGAKLTAELLGGVCGSFYLEWCLEFP